MKKVLIYGEFNPESTTGIAYINSNLAYSLKNIGYEVKKIIDPRQKDYFKNEKIIKKNINLKEFIKLFFFIIITKKHEISFITISLGNLGLLKTFIIQFLLNIKSKRSYLYVHRGDLNKKYKSSFYKKTIISLILVNAYKIIFLSEKFKKENIIKEINNKILVLPNSLSKSDSDLSKRLFQKKIMKLDREIKKIKFLYSGNIQKSKGIHNIIKAFDEINKKNNNYKLILDIFGMKLEKINLDFDFVNYKGKLDTNNRLEHMSKYDCLLFASLNEGLPMILIESLSIGLPFITTKVGAIEDLLINNYPYICKPNIKSIKNKINQFCFDITKNENLLKKIAFENYKLFSDNFKYSIFEKNISENIH